MGQQFARKITPAPITKAGWRTAPKPSVKQGEPPTAPSSVRDVLRSQGKPLDTQVRADMDPYAQRTPNATGMPVAVRGKMEQALGTDLSDVRVHHDSPLPAELGATAFARGRDIHVGPGNWTPETTRGQEILGHELAHVVQQQAGRVAPTVEKKGIKLNNEPALEAEADAIGRLAARSNAHPTATTRDALFGVSESRQSVSPRSSDGAHAPAQRLPGAYLNATPSQLHAGGVYQLLEMPAAASPWWPITKETRNVYVDGKKLEFIPGGEISGPLWIPGAYTILENTAKSLRMKLNLGTDDKHINKLNVTLSIMDGQATITGSIEGGVADTYSSPVAGSGTKSSPFHLDFVEKAKGKATEKPKDHHISWRVDG